MADEVFDSTDMVRQLFREGQSVTDEAGDALPQRVIEALAMIGFAGVLRNGFVLRRRNNPGVDRILIRIERRFPRGEMLQQSGMRLRSFCPENRMTCDCKVDRFILPRGWLSKGL